MNPTISALDISGASTVDQNELDALAAFDALIPGESFVLVNDRDLRPLLCHLQSARPGQFDWHVLEAGPRLFRVSIRLRPELGPRDVTEYLKYDHMWLDEQLARVDRLLGSDLAQAAQRLAEFCCGLNRHMEIEEKVLFPVYDKAAGDGAAATTEDLREDHIEIRAAMAAATSALQSGQIERYDAESQNLDLLLGGHNLKEESDIYPRMDRLLCSTPARDDLVRQMQAC